MTETPLHDWIAPKLAALLAEAEQAGFDRDAAVAVAIDLITGPAFNPPQSRKTLTGIDPDCEPVS